MAGLNFDVDGARQAGYSDDEILQHIAGMKDNKFDVNGALKSGYSPTEVINHLSPQPSGLGANVQQGAGEALEGAGNTLNKFGFTNVGPALSKYGKGIEPENFVPSPIVDEKGFHASGILPTLARSAPVAAASIAAAGLAPEALGAAGAIGAGALPGFLSSAGNDIDASGSTAKGVGTAALSSLATATPITKFLGGAAPAAKVGAAGALDAVKRLGVTTAEQAGASGAGNVIEQAGTTGTVDPTQVANAAAGGAAGGALFAGARKTLPEILNARKYSDIGNDPAMLDAAKMAANRIQTEAGGENLQGSLLRSGSAQRAGAAAYNKAASGVTSELNDAVSKVQTKLPQDADNVLKSAMNGEMPNKAGYATLEAGLGNDPQADNVLNLVRQAHVLDIVGDTGRMVGDKFTGGLGGMTHHILSGEHIAKSGLVGLMALAGEHAGHVIAFSPTTLGAAAGIAGGGRLLDNLTGAQAPAGRFVRNFANGGDTRLNVPQPQQPQPAPPQQTAPLPVAGGSMMTPAAKALQTMAQLAAKNAAPAAPTGTATPPVAGGRMITPNVLAQMKAADTLQKLRQPVAPPPAGPIGTVQPPVAGGSAITPQVRASMDAMAKLQKFAQPAPVSAEPTPEPAIDPLRLPTSITSPARSIMRGAATAQKLADASGATPGQMREANDLMAARRANEKLANADIPESQPTATSAPAPAVTAPLPQAKGSIITPNVRALMNAQAASAKLAAKAPAAPAPAAPAAPAPSAIQKAATNAWSPERVAKMQELLAKGMTTAQVGAELGVTKNAIIGKSNRLRQAEKTAPAAAPAEGPLHREVPSFPEPQAAYQQGVTDYRAGKMDRTYPRGDLQASYDRGAQDAMSASRSAPKAPAPAKAAEPSDNNWLSAARDAIQNTPKPKAVSKAKGKPIETKTETPAGDEYTVPRSPYAHLPPEEAALKIYQDAKNNGKFLGDKEGFIAGITRNINSHRSRAQFLNDIPGVNGDEIAAQFEGIRNQAAAIRHREWLKKQFPQAAPMLDEAFSDKYIKSGVWKKKGL